MTILAMVHAEKEGQIESKMMKARQMEEIREARRKEAEARQEQKKSKLVRISLPCFLRHFYVEYLPKQHQCLPPRQEEIKGSLRRRRKPKGTELDHIASSDPPLGTKGQNNNANRKRVSFA